MKRFLLFQYDYFHPSGGMGDYAGQFDTLEEAKAACNMGRDSWDILDIVHHRWHSRHRIIWPSGTITDWEVK
jgi:hypothetical protein